MSSDFVTVPAFDAPARPPFAERSGAVLISLFFHLALFAMLWSLIIEKEEPPPPTRTVMLSITPPPPEMSMTIPPPVIEEMITEAVRTSPFGERQDNRARENLPVLEGIFRSSEGSDDVSNTDVQPSAPEPTFVDEEAEIVQPLDLDSDVLETLETYTDLAQRENERFVLEQQGIRARLFQEQDEIETSNAEYHATGAIDGHVREIDLDDIPLAIAQQVLQRYDARLGYGIVSPDDVMPNAPVTLSAARVEHDLLTAHNTEATGPVRYIQYDNTLAARLIDLEFNEIAHRGINSSEVTITRTVFGVRQVVTGWDFYVREIEYTELN